MNSFERFVNKDLDENIYLEQDIIDHREKALSRIKETLGSVPSAVKKDCQWLPESLDWKSVKVDTSSALSAAKQLQLLHKLALEREQGAALSLRDNYDSYVNLPRIKGGIDKDLTPQDTIFHNSGPIPYTWHCAVYNGQLLEQRWYELSQPLLSEEEQEIIDNPDEQMSRILGTAQPVDLFLNNKYSFFYADDSKGEQYCLQYREFQFPRTKSDNDHSYGVTVFPLEIQNPSWYLHERDKATAVEFNTRIALNGKEETYWKLRESQSQGTMAYVDTRVYEKDQETNEWGMDVRVVEGGTIPTRTTFESLDDEQKYFLLRNEPDQFNTLYQKYLLHQAKRRDYVTWVLKLDGMVQCNYEWENPYVSVSEKINDLLDNGDTKSTLLYKKEYTYAIEAVLFKDISPDTSSEQLAALLPDMEGRARDQDPAIVVYANFDKENYGEENPYIIFNGESTEGALIKNDNGVDAFQAETSRGIMEMHMERYARYRDIDVERVITDVHFEPFL